MVILTIDGRKLQAEKGNSLLTVAQNNNIYIPTLCNNEAVAAYGACRLCLVEVTDRGRKRLVTSCLYPASEGLVVETQSERVVKNRQMIMELLLARCPNNETIKKLAQDLGVEKTRFKKEVEDCILCGLCVRVCKEVVGVSAIGLVDRGTQRKMGSPFYEPSAVCIGCGSCAYVCPTGAIRMEDISQTRKISFPTGEIELKMKKCKTCGRYWATEREIAHMAKLSNQPLKTFDTCPDCRD